MFSAALQKEQEGRVIGCGKRKEEREEEKKKSDLKFIQFVRDAVSLEIHRKSHHDHHINLQV